MRLMLAPMEGVIDYTFREMLSSLGGLDRCVTEFVRVNEQVLPKRVFYRLCPELQHDSLTKSGTPVFIQLLGSNPEIIAKNAIIASKLGAAGIDLNFGCPAKTVNKSRGGSILLNEPELVGEISKQVRDAVDHRIPVTVKIRLGYENSEQFEEITSAVINSGCNELVIHARTKADAYKPPAYWHRLEKISNSSPIPIIANGEIWNIEDYRQCKTESSCDDIMIGRGLLAQPGLAKQITSDNKDEMLWNEVLILLEKFATQTELFYEPKYVGNRVKQWLGYLRLNYQEAEILFQAIKRMTCPVTIKKEIIKHQKLYA